MKPGLSLLLESLGSLAMESILYFYIHTLKKDCDYAKRTRNSEK